MRRAGGAVTDATAAAAAEVALGKAATVAWLFRRGQQNRSEWGRGAVLTAVRPGAAREPHLTGTASSRAQRTRIGFPGDGGRRCGSVWEEA